MLPEQIAEIIGEEHYKRLSHKFDSLLIHHTDRSDLSTIMVELIQLSYIKGRKDDRYYSKGPNIRNSLYENKEDSHHE